ncbi:hypothetical protein BOTBODRAFT_405556 [Botryobasidium botryosum FD-172 SS1]|uniref:Transcription activator of gluconeogenesis ERT1 n=1 Tax=Botryobasidium botryosum (strain FD-172 SS1) TaxID=930990 RepID=A0A067MB02_BOTB1|nr:hypothetical protein BOTBODRAFT_405556 [Botryobasidium botryosum FD-172 SS1]
MSYSQSQEERDPHFASPTPPEGSVSSSPDVSAAGSTIHIHSFSDISQIQLPPAPTTQPATSASPPESHAAIPGKRQQVKNACTNCQKLCKRCDDARPCFRCVARGIPEQCVDSQRKDRKKGVKRGPYKRRSLALAGKLNSIDPTPLCPLLTPLPLPLYAQPCSTSSSSPPPLLHQRARPRLTDQVQVQVSTRTHHVRRAPLPRDFLLLGIRARWRNWRRAIWPTRCLSFNLLRTRPRAPCGVQFPFQRTQSAIHTSRFNFRCNTLRRQPSLTTPSARLLPCSRSRSCQPHTTIRTNRCR